MSRLSEPRWALLAALVLALAGYAGARYGPARILGRLLLFIEQLRERGLYDQAVEYLNILLRRSRHLSPRTSASSSTTRKAAR